MRAAHRPREAGTRADSVSPFRQDRRRRMSHGGHWAADVVQLPRANPKPGKHSLFTVAQAMSIRYDHVLGFYTFRPRPPFWDAFTKLATQRHQAIHKGMIPTKGEAETSFKAASDVVAHLKEIGK